VTSATISQRVNGIDGFDWSERQTFVARLFDRSDLPLEPDDTNADGEAGTDAETDETASAVDEGSVEGAYTDGTGPDDAEPAVRACGPDADTAVSTSGSDVDSSGTARGTGEINSSGGDSRRGDSPEGDALEAGVSVTGCTVHVVTDATDDDGAVLESEVDAGPIVTQEPIPVYEGDDEEGLKERVLYEGEFRAYPRAVKWFAEGTVDVDTDAGEVSVDADVASTDSDDHDGREARSASNTRAAKPREGLPARRLVSDDRADTLRYGENPHQDAAVYTDYTCDEASVVHADQLNEGAKSLSYNNYNDADGALNLIKEFDEPAAAVIKHTNPAGCATADSVAEAYEKALSTDPMSAFGGIVALNRECDAATAEQVIDSFKEVVVAPGYTDDALEVLFEKDNLRVLDVGELGERTERFTEKPLVGGRLVQERDLQSISVDDLEVVTEREPTDAELESMVFAWQTLKHVKSNGILFTKGTETVGVGMGQVSRVDAVRLAAMKADEHAEGKDAEGAVMASDAFFPFPDGIEEAAKVGIEAVVQPGGSVNDEDVIEAANEHGMAMAFTGQRSFRHD